MMFSRAIVRQPAKSIVHGVSNAKLGLPDYKKALQQHASYVSALKECGLMVTELPADENFPDSTFVEDTALLTPHCAIITNPGEATRKGETRSIKDTLAAFYPIIEEISEPGTVEAGDIMMVADHFYIGLSQRTNKSGAQQLIQILNKYNLSGSSVKLQNVLHLKTGLSYLEDNNLVACGEFLNNPLFNKYTHIEIPQEESYAANSLWINDFVLVPQGYPQTAAKIRNAGYSVIEIDVSEFRKVDGGLSCLSLRF